MTERHKDEIMHSRDWILLVVNAAGDGQLSHVQLQKSLFLLKENLPSVVGQDFYEFEPYSYGPFCAEIYNDAEQMEIRTRLIHIDRGDYKQYSVTPQGRECALALEESLDSVVADYVRGVVQWAMGLSFNELVRAIYSKYPAYAVNSVFQD